MIEVVTVARVIKPRFVTTANRRSYYFRGGQAQLNSRLCSCKCRCPWLRRVHQAKTSSLEACFWLVGIFYAACSQRFTPPKNFKANSSGLFTHSFYVDLSNGSSFDLRWQYYVLLEIDQEKLTVALKWSGSGENQALEIPYFCWQIPLSTRYSNQDHRLICLRHSFFDPLSWWLINRHHLFDLAYSNGQFCLILGWKRSNFQTTCTLCPKSKPRLPWTANQACRAWLILSVLEFRANLWHCRAHSNRWGRKSQQFSWKPQTRLVLQNLLQVFRPLIS